MRGDSHSIATRIFQALSEPDSTLSARGFALEIGEPLSKVSYGFKKLEAQGRIEKAEASQRVPRLEVFYRKVRRA
jgi:hypothetical protein